MFTASKEVGNSSRISKLSLNDFGLRWDVEDKVRIGEVHPFFEINKAQLLQFTIRIFQINRLNILEPCYILKSFSPMQSDFLKTEFLLPFLVKSENEILAAFFSIEVFRSDAVTK